VQDALQASSSVNLCEPDASVFSDAKDGMAGCQARLKAGDIENFAPERSNAQDFCLTQLREIITELSDEKAELMGQLSKSQEKAAEAEARLQHVTSECSKWSDEVCVPDGVQVSIHHSEVLLTSLISSLL
jgi:hypothetical protein